MKDYVLDRGKAYENYQKGQLTTVYRNEDGSRKHPLLSYNGRNMFHEKVRDTVKDHEKYARVFIIERRQLIEFENATWDDYDPAYCCPPYTTFIIRPAEPVNLKYSDNLLEEMENNIANDLFLEEIFVHFINDYECYIIEFLKINHHGIPNKRFATGVHANLENGTVLPIKYDDEWIGNFSSTTGEPIPFSIRNKYIDNKANAIFTECQLAARDIITFLHLINNRKTEVKSVPDTNRPATRQQRRSEGYIERPHYKVTIPPRKTVSDLVEQAMAGKQLRYRRPHKVRRHIRHLKSREEVVWVSEHTRCGILPSSFPLPEYDLGRIKPKDIEAIS